MNVADLAREFDLPPSRVIDLCSWLEIDATWAGADLSRSDELRLRSRLGQESGPADRDHPGRVEHRVGTTEALPPTAAGSFPGLAEDHIPDHSAPGFVFAGDTLATAEEAAGDPQVRRPPSRSQNQARIFDPSLRPAIIATVLAVGGLVAAEVLDLAPAALVGWLLAAICFVIALVSANRARYRITTHPERRRGLPIALILLVVATLGLTGLGLGIWTVVRSAPTAQAPLGLGERHSVQHLRWGYQRLRLIADNGWARPAKDAGTCWEAVGVDDDPRVEHRMEHGYNRVSCDSDHQFEVLAVHSINRDADAPFPGEESLAAEALERCADIARDLVSDAPGDLMLLAEIPTREGWERADHDVTCVSALPRNEPLLG